MRKVSGSHLCVVTLFCLFAAATITAQNIQTVAGGGPNDVPAVDANFGNPWGVAVDGSENTYVAVPSQNRVFKVDASGQLTVVAGNGTPGYSGDGGPATSASLRGPSGVAVDSVGNLYISDTSNQRIRRVDTSGNISTVAGNGTYGYGGDGGVATDASLRDPFGVAVDITGNVYIADTDNERIRKVDTAGKISTVAGNGSVGFNGDGGLATNANLHSPLGVAMDAAGNLYIADTGNGSIRKVSANGNISTVAGISGTGGFSGDGGPATSAMLGIPSGIGVDSDGNLYIADSNNGRIRKVDTSGTIATVAGDGIGGFVGDGGPATIASLMYPRGVALDSARNLYIADTNNNRIRKVDTSGNISTVAGNGSFGYSGDGGLATSAGLYNPFDVSVDGSGNLYIADTNNNRIRKVDASGNISTVAGNGTAGYSGDGGAATSASLASPYGVAVDGAGDLYIADAGNSRIRKVDASGNISTVAGNGTEGYSGDGGPATSAGLLFPARVAVDSAGNLYIADTDNQRIRRVDASGIISTVAGNGTAAYSGDGGAATSASLAYPKGITIDSAGNLFIADTDNQRVRKVDISGNISTVAGGGSGADGGPAISASLAYPWGVAIDSTGDLFIGDTSSQRIRKVDNSGIISTVAGNGSYGYSGDGGPATSAMLTSPSGVAVNGAGDVFIADTNNQRVRKVTVFVPAPAVSLSPTSVDFGDEAQGAQSTPQTVTVSNTGTADLHVSEVSATGDFLETNDCVSGVVSPGYSCNISVSFLPTATGTRTGTLTITDDAGDSPQSVSLTGNGTVPLVPGISLSSTSLTFSNQAVGTSSPVQSITLTSSGTAALTVGSITVSGDFALATTGGSCPYGGGIVAVGASCTIDVTVTPAQSGTRTGSITITDDAAGSPQTVSLTGTAVAPPTGPLNGLVSYWSFDEGSGQAMDIISGNNGTLGPAVTRVPGIAGSGAVAFDNTSNAYVDVGAGVNNDFSFTTGMTVAAIIKPEWNGAYGDYDEIFRKDDDNNRILFSFQNTNGIGGGTGPVLSFGINVGGAYDELDMELDGQSGRPTLAQLEDGNPHYVVATYNSNNGLKAIYVDGTLRDSISYPAGTLMASGGPCSAAIGNYSCGYFQEPFTGTIDEVRVYNRALAPAEIASIVKFNPVPFISQPLAPSATAPGGADFTLTLNGTGFTSGSVVNWNGTPLVTTFVSNTQLTVAVPAGNIASAGTASITVFNPAPGGTSNAAYFEITNPTTSVSFGRTDYTSGGNPGSVAVGDFNGDGKTDLAVANIYGGSGAVLLGNGDGTFQAALVFTVAGGSNALVAADFDGDGKLDLAVTNWFGNNISVLLGKGDGTFKTPVNFTTGNNPVFAAAADFNADGKLDLAVLNYGSNNMSILLGNGDGTFRPPVFYPSGVNTWSIAVADFNRDGKLDLAVAYLNGNSVSVLLGNGDGTFQSPLYYGAGSYPYSVTAGDFDGNGKQDMAVADFQDGTVSVLLGKGDGTFQPAVAYAAATARPFSITAVDVNGDGKLDLAVANADGNNLSVLLGNGDGAFQPVVDFAVGAYPTWVAAGDFNGDGRMDMAVANSNSGSVSVLLQGPLASLSTSSLDFGSQGTGTTSAAQTVTITNSGAALLNITNISMTGANPGDFGFTSDSLPISIAPGNTTMVQVTFSPTAGGSRSATLSLTDNAGNSPQSIALSGTGLTPQQVTQDNINQVNALYSQGVISSGQENSLVKELQKAIDMMNKGKINGAISNLEDFISEVNDLLNSGVLTSDQASSLINAANAVIAELI
jgi:Concanavalin A-like lectin/glucanases superfamily/FG-GAP-like repeat/HYDIN/CFA65/VesB-like, Ig-like domain/Abnormal spindle-like microcephaly-assoc'd, ASPM-SPD-2-Hydin/FIMAH domain/NHL repeat